MYSLLIFHRVFCSSQKFKKTGKRIQFISHVDRIMLFSGILEFAHSLYVSIKFSLDFIMNALNDFVLDFRIYRI